MTIAQKHEGENEVVIRINMSTTAGLMYAHAQLHQTIQSKKQLKRKPKQICKQCPKRSNCKLRKSTDRHACVYLNQTQAWPISKYD